MTLNFAPSALPISLFNFAQRSATDCFSESSFAICSPAALFLACCNKRASIMERLRSVFRFSSCCFFIASGSCSGNSICFCRTCNSSIDEAICFSSPCKPESPFWAVSTSLRAFSNARFNSPSRLATAASASSALFPFNKPERSRRSVSNAFSITSKRFCSAIAAFCNNTDCSLAADTFCMAKRHWETFSRKAS